MVAAKRCARGERGSVAATVAKAMLPDGVLLFEARFVWRVCLGEGERAHTHTQADEVCGL